jgi:hypothetical protein
MRNWIAGALALAALAGSMHAQEKGFGQSLVVFQDANYSGNSFSVTGELSALGRETQMNDKASSVRVSGSWELCADANFRGKCVTVTQDVPDLKVLGMNNNISSIRPSGGFGGGNGGGSGGGEHGGNVTKYDSPRWQGVPLFYCGKSLVNCGKRNADAFCKLAGHNEAVTYSAGDRTNARGYVAVDRVYQDGGMMFASISCLGAVSGGGGGGGGQPSTNYPNPEYQGAPIAYCGKGGGNCGEANANAYCKYQGHTNAVSYTEGSNTKFQVYSPSELSFRTGGRTYRAISCAGLAGGGGGPGFGGGNSGGSGGGSSGSNAQVFNPATLSGLRVSSCGKGTNTCGKVAADAFCRAQGMSSSSSHKLLSGTTGPLIDPTDNTLTLMGQAFDLVVCIR